MKGLADLRRAEAYYRHIAAVADFESAAAYRARAALAPEAEAHGPCPAYPDGWVSHPRRNLLTAARRAEASGRAWIAMADRIAATIAHDESRGAR